MTGAILISRMTDMSLRSFDIVVGLKAHLWEGTGGWSYERLGAAVGVSASQAHSALRRLQRAGLWRETDRSLPVHAFTAFAVHGIPHVFPAELGGLGVGVPTAHAAPPLRDQLVYTEAYIWAAEAGVPGRELKPLHPFAPLAASRDADLYAALALVDALRVGRVRDRRVASLALERLLNQRDRDAAWVRAREGRRAG